VNNFKWGLVSAIFAFFISILLGLVSGVTAGHVFLRALVFSIVFFGIGFGLRFIINSFFPELLYINNDEITPSESSEEGHISIAMDSMGEYAVPELFNQGDAPELGNIDDLISGVFRPGGGEKQAASEPSQPAYSTKIDFSISDEGIDQNKETGYNGSGVIEDVPFGGSSGSSSGGFNETPAAEKAPAFQPQFTPSIGDDSGLGGLPDLDMMAMAFSNLSGPSPSAASSPSDGSAGPAEEAEAPDRGQYKGNKPQPLKGDFDPQTLAEGIRTVLSKD